MSSFVCRDLSGSRVRASEGNQGTVALVESVLGSAWIKNVDGRCEFVSELLRANEINIQWVVSQEQRADTPTNSFAATSFNITVNSC